MTRPPRGFVYKLRAAMFFNKEGGRARGWKRSEDLLSHSFSLSCIKKIRFSALGKGRLRVGGIDLLCVIVVRLLNLGVLGPRIIR